jgi:mRNA interferase MazF
VSRKCPNRGDLIWTDFDPQSGHEQAGKRPALVLSPSIYNRRLGLAIVCPITSRVKGYTLAVTLPAGLPIHGDILVDQVTTIDWKARGARVAGRVSGEVLTEVVAKRLAIIDHEE